MSLIRTVLSHTAHRPWPLPSGRWAYYQEWNKALFLHWSLPADLLRPFVPEQLALDEMQGTAWVSLVAFTMEKIRPRLLPALSAISNFHELNLRTYVDHQGKAGVYFLSIEAQKAASAFIARRLSGLPYRKAAITRTTTGTGHRYDVYNRHAGFRLHSTFTTEAAGIAKQAADTWLTERYCLYSETKKQLFRFDIQHQEWPLQAVQVSRLEVQYRAGDFDLSVRAPDLIHYSPGIQVLAWHKTRI